MTMPFKITEIWAWVAEESNGSEGIVGSIMPGIGAVPLIGADRERIESYRDLANEMNATRPWLKIRLVRFHAMEVMEDLRGPQS